MASSHLVAPLGEFPVTDHRLYINGVAVAGTLESLGGANWQGRRLDRNAYIRIDADVGDVITSVGFENITTPLGGNDWLEFDHLAFQAIPEPSSTALFVHSPL